MNRLQDAWEVAAQMQMPEMWEQLAHRAMTHMEIEFAIRVYRFVGDASMVMSLERLEHIEDKDMLAGNILILFERDDCYDMAQELFLRSGRPQAALEMRKDLKHWEEALELAKTADPGQLDDICREYAGVLESRGEHDAALELYERAVKYPDQSDKELARGNAGIARCLLHLGDVRRGKIIALDSGSEQLCRECADICEKLQQHEDAAQLYERGGEYEKAAAIYIDTKLFHLARPIMQKVSTPKLHARYARAKENEGKLKEAADAYELARDFDSVVRLQLEHLGDPDKAFALVRMSRSVDGALMCAKWCKGEGDAAAAIEFLLIGRKVDEAFQRLRAAFNGQDLAVLGDIQKNFAPPQYVERSQDDYFDALDGDADFREWVERNVSPHKHPSYASVTISLKGHGDTPGDATSDQMRAIADLAEHFAHDELRISHEQNIVLPHVAQADLPAIYRTLKSIGLATANIGLISDIIACPGMDYCALATARSIPIAQDIALRYASREAEIGHMQIKISGCINACGHHHVGHVGILGLDKAGVENYQITLGGRAGNDAAIGEKMGRGFNVDELMPALDRLIDAYLALRRHEEEIFAETVKRLGTVPFQEALYVVDQAA